MKKTMFYTYFILLNLNVYSDSINNKKNQINQINYEIKKKSEEIKKNSKKIKTIEKKTETLKEQINRVVKELKIIADEKFTLQKKIEIVYNKIDYGKRNLKFNSKELIMKKNEYIALLQAWQRTNTTNNNDLYNFKELLNANKQRQKKIIGVQKDIEEVKNDIEVEQEKLKKLKKQLISKEKQQKVTKKLHNDLIKKYSEDKKKTKAKTVLAQNKISQLKREKAAIEKEINNIIKNSTKQLKYVDYSIVHKNLGKFKKPLKGSVIVKFDQVTLDGLISSGEEISGIIGEQIFAGNRGKVIFSGKFMNMGKVIMIDHGYNLISIYGNLISTYVKKGQTIKKGDKVGILGLDTNGRSYFYYETRFNLKPTNPSIF